MKEMEQKPTPAPPIHKFPAFPFDPYPIQIDFMNALYYAVEKGGVAMLESPTGTGKTLSIICSALQWIVDQKSKSSPNPKAAGKDSRDQSATDDDEPDWMRNFSRAETTKKMKKLGFGLGSCNKKCSDGNCANPVTKESRKRVERKRNVEGVDDDEEFLVEEYDSGDEGIDGGDLKRKAGDGCFSSSDDDREEEEEQEEEEVLKVYFCSRTHSQLSQFVKELKRTTFASEMKVVCLGSRKNFCINSDVLRIGNPMRINERCLELQKNKNQKGSKIKILGDGGRIRRTKASSGCPMLRKQNLQKQFRNEVCQSGALDMEDLVQLGKKIGTCPYYGSRSVVPAANLVILPYQSLLLKSARESLGLNLKNSIVLIDEAHNLADSLTNMYNTKITLSQLDQVNSHLEKYLDRFRNQLGAGNRRYIQILMVITRAFLRLILGDMDTSSAHSCHAEEALGEKNVCVSTMNINDFLFSLNIDNINLVKLSRYIKESNIMHKVSGYGTKLVSLQSGLVLQDSGNNSLEGSSLSGFQSLVDILLSLTNNDSDGRMIVSRCTSTCSRQDEEGYLKYVMLAGEKIFSEIADQARAVVLAGGTLQPIEETRQRLFPCLLPDRFHFFSCNHIVPPDSILPIAVSRGPSGCSFDFSYNSRSSPSMIDELGRLLCNLVGVVPEGIVMFFSSFEYEGQVYDAWKASGILARILKKKRIFREPRNSMDVETVLKQYKEAISLPPADLREDLQIHGALLLAVVGGKISEGINFSDGMGRCVVMVGLPYPSPSDVELMERIKHIEGRSEPNANRHVELLGNDTCTVDAVQTGFDIIRSCRRRGKEYYENLCMKAVNQSIGRAIRHINDYAAILLVDSRYASNSLKGSLSYSYPTNKLPQWIKDSLVSSTENYGEVHRRLHQFFKFHKQRRYQ